MQILLLKLKHRHQMLKALLADVLVLERITVREVRKQDRDLFRDDWVLVADHIEHSHDSFHL